MQINQITGGPIGFESSTGVSSNFFNSISSRPENSAVSSLRPLMSVQQCAQTSSDLGRQVLSSAKISHTSDVVKTLREHPAYMHMPEGEIEAIAAAALSAGCCAGGIVLLAMSGGSSAPFSIALASIVLTSAGGTGATKAIQGAIQGNFSWREWSRDVVISTGASLITFGAGYASAAGVTYLLLNHESITLTACFMETIAKISGAVAGSAAQGTTYSIIKECSGEQIQIFELFIECVAGAYAGGAAGKMAFNAQLRPLIRSNVVGHNKGRGFYKESIVFTKGRNTMHVFITKGRIIGTDLHLIKGKIKNATHINGLVLVLSGTHGDKEGQTVLETMNLVAHEFFQSDQEGMIPHLNLNFKKRAVDILNLAEFREPNALLTELKRIRPDTIVLNFCHGDQAMEKGKLGTIIAQAFQEMHIS